MANPAFTTSERTGTALCGKPGTSNCVRAIAFKGEVAPGNTDDSDAANVGLAGLSPLAPWHYLTDHKPFCFDVQPLLALGWRPRYSNDEMFRESYDWFRANREKLAELKSQSPHRRIVREGILWLLKKMS
jgi:hypothetical protein